MKTIKVSDATNTQLDWLVAKCEGLGYFIDKSHFDGVYRYGAFVGPGRRHFVPTTSWSQMGPIIEREKINTEWWHMPQEWHVCTNERLQYDEKGDFVEGSDFHVCGPTPLIAAARCYIVSKLGQMVEVPEELA